MTPTHLCILLLAVVATGSVTGQNDEIPVESDNQFPPDAPADVDDHIIEGSGDGTLDEPSTGQSTEKTTTPIAPLEDVILSSAYNADQSAGPTTDDPQCPAMCVCHSAEGDSNSYVVDCSGYDLAEFPAPLDPRTTTLNVQNNKLTEIPKTISLLKNLQVLNAGNNSISDFRIALGSISELEQLKVLKLSNNRIIEYPLDLKNSFGLTKLQELDLGGNDMRTELTPQLFSYFKSLKTLIIPSSIPEKEAVIENLCGSLRETLQKVCADTCSIEETECSDAPQNLDEDHFLDVIPGMISLDTSNNETSNVETDVGTEETPEELDATGSDVEAKETTSELPLPNNTNENKILANANEDILRSENEEQASQAIQRQSMIIDNLPTEQNNNNNTDPGVKVGATTDASKGGVDKSVIGLIVAGMVLVVAGITIKKNWGSIRKRFSSTPRQNELTAAIGTGSNATGMSPEEMPLQDKNPV